MHIGELSEAVGLSHRTIRHYDDVGLLPASRTEGGFRVYTDSDKERMLTIRTLKPLGFSLEEMRQILDCLDAANNDDDARARLAEHTAEIARRRERMAQDLQRADQLLGRLRN